MYQVNDKIIDLLKDYLSNRRQQVKLGNVNSLDMAGYNE